MDDEHSVRRVGERALRNAGFDVLVAASGAQALELFEENQNSVALVVLDMSMPEMSGQQTLEHLRQQNDSVPVLVSTGFGAAETAEQMSSLGALGFLQKPYRLATLVAAVKTALRLG